eukprot:1147755-Pelagomonas_calceolata.AAC.1
MHSDAGQAHQLRRSAAHQFTDATCCIRHGCATLTTFVKVPFFIFSFSSRLLPLNEVRGERSLGLKLSLRPERERLSLGLSPLSENKLRIVQPLRAAECNLQGFTAKKATNVKSCQQ